VSGGGQGIQHASETTLHATCVAVDGRGLLIRGASGSGKSALALWLIGLGAGLVADDRVILKRDNDALKASAPGAISAMIEARGLGLLNAQPCGPVPLAYVVDLDRTEAARMPPLRSTELLGLSLPLLFGVDAPHFPAALMQMMKEGRRPGT